MKPLRDWDISDVEMLIKNKGQEDLHLDYKRSNSLENNNRNKDEISKDVSAFANSDGGIIVYGIIEEGHLPKKIDDGIETEGKREWLEQVINSNINPRIQNLIIKQIDLESHPGKAIFVVEIPVGITAHQASDLKYYKRFNFQSVPMHDYEVKMTIDRLREPNIALHIDLSVLLTTSMQIPLEINAKNIGAISAPSAFIKFFIPTEFWGGFQGELWHLEKEPTIYNGIKVVALTCSLGASKQTELFPGLEIPISKYPSDTICVKLNQVSAYNPSPVEITVFYEVYATNMKPKREKSMLKIVPNQLMSLK